MSALTSLLVRDDVVSVRQIEDALQRQVLEGGELDTALLELCDVPENVLTSYRAASFRAPPAGREEVMSASHTSRVLLGVEHAVAFGVTPLSHEIDALVVASANPLSEARAAELSAKVGLPIVWRITGEARAAAALARYYDVPLSPRMRELVQRVDARDAGELPVVEPLQVTPPAVLSSDLMQGFDESEDFEAVLEAAFERVSAAPTRMSRPSARARSAPLSQTAVAAALEGGRRGAAGQAPGRRGSSASSLRASPARAPARREQTRPLSAGIGVDRRADPRIPKGPLTDAVAIKLLEQAQERDTVVELLFRYARQYFDTTVLFTVREDRAMGLEGYNLRGVTDIREVNVKFVRGSALDDLVRSLLPRVVDLNRKDQDQAFAAAMLRTHAQPGALIPVCIKRRVVSFVYGDRDGEGFGLEDLAPLVGLLPHVSRAFERIIRMRKALALNAHRALAAEQVGELGEAPTERTLPETQGEHGGDASNGHAAGSDQRGALDVVDARTRQALNSLGVPRTAPPPPSPDAARNTRKSVSMPARVSVPDQADDDREPTMRMDIQPLPLDEPARASTSYYAKPPPGTGRYSSLRPAAATSAQPATSAEPKRVSEPPAEDTKPVRRSRSSQHASRRPAKPSARPSSPDAMEHSAPAPRSSKPPPGAGSYRREGFTTEVISVPSLQDVPAGAADGGQDVRSQPPSAQEPSAAQPPLAANFEPTIIVDERAQIEALIVQLCECTPDHEGPFVQQLLAFGPNALPPLAAAFPGPLWFDRRRGQARLPLGRDLGPVARALAAFGDDALACFPELLRSTDLSVRYYASVFVSDRVYPTLLEPLIERLFDDDAQIRLIARDALPHYRRVPGFSRMTARLRVQAADAQALLKARLAAIDAIAVLRDGESVPALIDLLADADRQLSLPAHRALVAITCQDFGKSVRKWRAWYREQGEHHRVEWLIASLMHGEQHLRAAAGQELQKVTQVYYGYAAAAPKRERESAHKRYLDWWQREGRSKF